MTCLLHSIIAFLLIDRMAVLIKSLHDRPWIRDSIRSMNRIRRRRRFDLRRGIECHLCIFRPDGLRFLTVVSAAPAAGLSLATSIGARVAVGDELFILHTETPGKLACVLAITAPIPASSS